MESEALIWAQIPCICGFDSLKSGRALCLKPKPTCENSEVHWDFLAMRSPASLVKQITCRFCANHRRPWVLGPASSTLFPALRQYQASRSGQVHIATCGNPRRLNSWMIAGFKIRIIQGTFVGVGHSTLPHGEVSVEFDAGTIKERHRDVNEGYPTPVAVP